MNLLILGGTIFLGRHLTEAALARGHRVTLFNRGRSQPGLFPDVETLIGDRDGDLSALSGRRWEAAIDTSGYLPRIVRASAEALAPAVEHYSFVSSISVYPEGLPAGVDEDHPVATIDDPDTETLDGRSYGPLKALCEKAAEAAMPGRVLNVRPGLIAGPHDPTDRFTYWPLRIARGGPFLAPEGPDVPTQFIDVRDLAEWMLDAAESRLTGTYNATGPASTLTLGGLFSTCIEATDSDTQPRWLPPDAIAAAELRPFLDLPLWVPPDARGSCQIDCSKAIAAGLTFRAVSTIIADTLAWAREHRPAGTRLRAGLTADQEHELLHAT